MGGAAALLERCASQRSDDSPEGRLRNLEQTARRVGFDDFALAQGHFAQGNYSNAIASCSQHLKYCPEAVGPLYLRACAYGNTGNYNAAVTDFTAAMERNPMEPIYFRERAEAYRRLGLMDLARKDAHRATYLEADKY